MNARSISVRVHAVLETEEIGVAYKQLVQLDCEAATFNFKTNQSGEIIPDVTHHHGGERNGNVD